MQSKLQAPESFLNPETFGKQYESMGRIQDIDTRAIVAGLLEVAGEIRCLNEILVTQFRMEVPESESDRLTNQAISLINQRRPRQAIIHRDDLAKST